VEALELSKIKKTEKKRLDFEGYRAGQWGRYYVDRVWTGDGTMWTGDGTMSIK